MDILQRIQYLLKKNNINASKMSKDIGISSGLFSQWKNGKQKPSTEKIQLIAKYFNVSTDYLLGNEQKEKNSPSEDNEILRLIKNELDECDKDTAETILQQIKLIKSLRNK